jgi:ATP-binding cassette subfamily B multidrug efflux pump
LRKLLAYLKPHARVAIAAPLLMMLEVVMDLIQPKLMASIIDQGVKLGDINFILRTSGYMVAVALLGAVGGVGCSYFSSIASTNVGTDLRRDLFSKVQELSFTNLNTLSPDSLITRLTNDVTLVQHLVLVMLRMLVRAPLLCIGGIIMAVTINARLALILTFSLPLLLVALFLIMRISFPLFGLVQSRLDKVNEVLRENLSGARVIKAFVRADYENHKFANANEALTSIGMRAGRLVGSINPIMILVMNSTVIAVLWFGGIHVNIGGMQVGEVMAFINYTTQILFSMMMVTVFLMNISRAKASADRINEVFDTKVDIQDAPGASSQPINEGQVAFHNVSFQYKGASGPPVLKNITFTAQPGETVAILGSTGAGKSTLVNLIPRFYDVTEGCITIDGTDIRQMKLSSLRDSIGMVLQESILFSGTIGENISWGRANASDEDIVTSAQAAQVHEFIATLPDGYQTMVGQRGVNLSGGQKQRLAIARALLKRPKVLIMDDSTSAIDMGTEARLQVALRQLLAETTCFIIAQRISSVIDADRIIVLEDGQIVGSGTHSQLMNSCPVYQDIYHSQLGKEAV